MRVTIEHREDTAGYSGKTRNCFVVCNVEFSEEERAIVKARSLSDYLVMEAHLHAPPPSSAIPYLMVPFGFVVGLVGFGLLVSSIFGSPWGGIGFWLLLGGGAAFIYGRLNVSVIESPFELQQITIGTLFKVCPLSIYAPNPAEAKALDGQFREALTNVKHLISASAELRGRETFEL